MEVLRGSRMMSPWMRVEEREVEVSLVVVARVEDAEEDEEGVGVRLPLRTESAILESSLPERLLRELRLPWPSLITASVSGRGRGSRFLRFSRNSLSVSGLSASWPLYWLAREPLMALLTSLPLSVASC